MSKKQPDDDSYMVPFGGITRVGRSPGRMIHGSETAFWNTNAIQINNIMHSEEDEWSPVYTPMAGRKDAALHFWHQVVPSEFKVSRSMRAIWEDIPKCDPLAPYNSPANVSHAGRIVIAGLRRSGLTTTGILDFLHFELNVLARTQLARTQRTIEGLLICEQPEHIRDLILGSPLCRAFSATKDRIDTYKTHNGSVLSVVRSNVMDRQGPRHLRSDWVMWNDYDLSVIPWGDYARTVATRVIDPNPPYVEHTLLPDAPSMDWRPNESLPEDYHL